MEQLVASSSVKLERIYFQKMCFIMNALDKGWTVKKSDNEYIFYKKHEGKKEVFQEEYLRKFIESNMVLGEKND
jgi:hypothetical protein